MNTIIEKIRAEIERRMKELEKDKTIHPANQAGRIKELDLILSILSDLEKEEKPSEGLEIDIEKFIEKMDAWKARFSRPDDIPIKATMAFTARMFYMYPKVARKWYESLPKAIQD